MPFTWATQGGPLGYSGRIQPVNFTPDGDWSYVLGSDVAGKYAKINPTDYAQLLQNADFDTNTIFRYRAKLRAPATMPAQVEWVASLLIDGVVKVRRVIEPSRDRDLVDLGGNTEVLTAGNHDLKFRLELESGLTGPFEVEIPGYYLDGLTFAAP